MTNNAWKGRNLVYKIILFSLFFIEMAIFPLIEYTFRKPTVGIPIIVGIGTWFISLFYVNKLRELAIVREYGGEKRLEGRRDHGNGDTGSFAFNIKEIYTLDDANDYLRKRVRIGELQTLRAEAKAYQYLQKKEPDFASQLKKPLLSTDEVEDLLHCAAIIPEVDENYEETATESVLTDKLLEHFYQLDTEKNPIQFNEKTQKEGPTEEFQQWKEESSALEKYVHAQIKKQLQKTETDSRPQIQRKMADRIAQRIARDFSLLQIKSAISDNTEGKQILGWLQQFKNYDTLIEKYHVLERALDIAEQISLPPVYIIHESAKLKDMIRSVVVLKEESAFSNEPDFPFDRIVIYADRPLETAVQWIQGINREVKGYPKIKMEVGFCNLNVFSKARYNIPMSVLAHGPGKGYARPKMQLDREEIDAEQQRFFEAQIDDLENDNTKLQARAHHFEVKEETQREINTWLINDVQDLMRKKTKDIINEAEDKFEKKEKAMSHSGFSTKTKKILKIFLLLSSIIGTIIFISFIFFSPAPANTGGFLPF
jgi:hypothetical protein